MRISDQSARSLGQVGCLFQRQQLATFARVAWAHLWIASVPAFHRVRSHGPVDVIRNGRANGAFRNYRRMPGKRVQAASGSLASTPADSACISALPLIPVQKGFHRVEVHNLSARAFCMAGNKNPAMRTNPQSLGWMPSSVPSPSVPSDSCPSR